MPSERFQLVANTVFQLKLDAPTQRVVVTQVDGTPAEIAVTSDGSAPSLGSNTEYTGDQKIIPALLGASRVFRTPQLSQPSTGAGPPGMVLATMRLLSNGTPIVNVEW